MSEQSSQDDFWWMQDHSLYGHGTFVSPETLGCFLTQEILSKKDQSPRSLTQYISWFFSEAANGVPDKQGSGEIDRPRLLKSSRQERNSATSSESLLEALTLFLDALPFEAFTVQSEASKSQSRFPSWEVSHEWKSEPEINFSEKHYRTLLRLPFPFNVPLDAIEITKPLAVSGCGSSLSDDEFLSTYKIKGQIQASLAGRVMDVLEIGTHRWMSNRNRSHKLRSSFTGCNDDGKYSCFSANSIDAAVDITKEHDKGSSRKTEWTSKKRCYKSLNDAILVFKEDVPPGMILGPPIGGELILTRESITSNHSSESLSEKEAILHGQESIASQPILSTPSDDGLQLLYGRMRDTMHITPDSSSSKTTHVQQLCYDNVCNELSLCRLGATYGNVVVITAMVYGIPYAFLVSGTSVRAGDTCHLNWPGYEKSVRRDILSMNRDSKRLTSIPIPLRSNCIECPMQLQLSSYISFSKGFHVIIDQLLQGLQNDENIGRTVLLLAKFLLFETTQPSCFSHVSLYERMKLRGRLTSTVLPNWKSLCFFVTTHQTFMRTTTLPPLSYVALRVLYQITNLLHFYFNTTATSPLSNPKIEDFSKKQYNALPIVTKSILCKTTSEFLASLLSHLHASLFHFSFTLPTKTTSLNSLLSTTSKEIDFLVFPADQLRKKNYDEHTQNRMKQVISVLQEKAHPRAEREDRFMDLCNRPGKCLIPPSSYLYSRSMSAANLPRESCSIYKATPVHKRCLAAIETEDPKPICYRQDPKYRYFKLQHRRKIRLSLSSDESLACASSTSSFSSRAKNRNLSHRNKRKNDKKRLLDPISPCVRNKQENLTSPREKGGFQVEQHGLPQRISHCKHQQRIKPEKRFIKKESFREDFANWNTYPTTTCKCPLISVTPAASTFGGSIIKTIEGNQYHAVDENTQLGSRYWEGIIRSIAQKNEITSAFSDSEKSETYRYRTKGKGTLSATALRLSHSEQLGSNKLVNPSSGHRDILLDKRSHFSSFPSHLLDGNSAKVGKNRRRISTSNSAQTQCLSATHIGSPCQLFPIQKGSKRCHGSRQLSRSDCFHVTNQPSIDLQKTVIELLAKVGSPSYGAPLIIVLNQARNEDRNMDSDTPLNRRKAREAFEQKKNKSPTPYYHKAFENLKRGTRKHFSSNSISRQVYNSPEAYHRSNDDRVTTVSEESVSTINDLSRTSKIQHSKMVQKITDCTSVSNHSSCVLLQSRNRRSRRIDSSFSSISSSTDKAYVGRQIYQKEGEIGCAEFKFRSHKRDDKS